MSTVAYPLTFASNSGEVPRRPRQTRFAPDVFAECQRCRRRTPTTYRLLSSGHVGNTCALCGACRIGRPYVSRSHLTQPPTPHAAAEGTHREHDSR